MAGSEERSEWSWVDLLPHAAIIGIVPLIVRLKVVSLVGSPLGEWTGAKDNWDFFSYYKAWWLILLVGLGMWRHWGKPSSLPPSCRRLLEAYGFLAIVSTVFSEYPDVALFGSFDRREGLFVLLAYAGTTFLFSQAGTSLAAVRRLLGVLLGSATLLGTMAACQFFGYDLLQSDLGKFLYLPEKYWPLVTQVVFQGGAGCANATFPNPNYSGSYFAMVFVLAFGLMLLSRDRRRSLMLPVIGILFVGLVGCRSRAGLVGAMVGVAGLVILSRRHWRANIGLLAAVAVLCLVLVFAMDFHSLLGSGGNRLLQVFSTERVANRLLIPTDFQALRLGDDFAEVDFASGFIRCTFRDKAFRFFDRSGREIPHEYKVQRVIFPPGEFRGFTVKAIPDQRVVQVSREDVTLNLVHTDKGFRIVDPLGRPKELRPIKRWWFDENDRWGNGRAYIWSRSLPLLGRALFSGFGPDTFLLEFPQDDFLGKIRAGYPLNWMVDKPHNLYLQIAINTGCLSLVVLLVLGGRYFWHSLALYGREQDGSMPGRVGASVWMAILAYAVTGMFNDSTVSVAPVFWGLLGLGMALNKE